MQQASLNGHTYLPEDALIASAAKLLEIDAEYIKKHLTDLSMDKKIIIKETDGQRAVYAAAYYYQELNAARMLCQLNLKYDVDMPAVRRMITRIEADEGLSLDEMQKMAVAEAAGNGVLIITGGPGTGKTTTINAIIKYFEYEGLEIRLAAPTGRAAKRMSEATGMRRRQSTVCWNFRGRLRTARRHGLNAMKIIRWRLMRSLLMRCLWLTLIC